MTDRRFEEQQAMLSHHRIEDGWYVPKGVKFGTYYRRHAESLRNVLPFIKNKKVALQGGGHLGAYPVWLGNYFQIVLTFEPNAALYSALVLNCYQKQADGVKCFNAAIALNTEVGKHAATIRIDDLGLRELGLLALDIEGGEHEALLGSVRTIGKCQPVILMEEAPEHHNQPEWFAKYGKACDLLRSLNYTMLTGEDQRCGPDRIWLPPKTGGS